jgi:hypothetical protein
MITKAMISFCQTIFNDDYRHVDTIQDFALSRFAQLSNQCSNFSFATNELVNDEFEFAHHLLQELLTAGTETSMYTVEWGITELIRNPMITKRAQTELETVVGNESHS